MNTPVTEKLVYPPDGEPFLPYEELRVAMRKRKSDWSRSDNEPNKNDSGRSGWHNACGN